MKNVLLITSSPRGNASHSASVATRLANSLGKVTHRDLVSQPLPQIDLDFILSTRAGGNPDTDSVHLSNELIAELQNSDVIVIAAGLINFGMPTNLKTWIDYVARPKLTFAYGENGPEGLVKGKKAILVLSYGGVYSSGPYQPYDFMEPHLRTALGFIGITDVETIRIEGVAFDEAGAIQRAEDAAKELVAAVA